jgi:hypothetical protein
MSIQPLMTADSASIRTIVSVGHRLAHTWCALGCVVCVVLCCVWCVVLCGVCCVVLCVCVCVFALAKKTRDETS